VSAPLYLRWIQLTRFFEKTDSKKSKVQENRAIYITNLPRDATLDEIDIEFSKYGMIDQSVDGEKRIKMYTDDEGNFKGEALVVYFKKDSVAMAVKMMDDSWFRPGQGPNIRVQEADRSYKKTQDTDEVAKALSRKQRKNHGLNRAEMNR
jgi:HIV Tat-specific factor 1